MGGREGRERSFRFCSAAVPEKCRLQGQTLPMFEALDLTREYASSERTSENGSRRIRSVAKIFEFWRGKKSETSTGRNLHLLLVLISSTLDSREAHLTL